MGGLGGGPYTTDGGAGGGEDTVIAIKSNMGGAGLLTIITTTIIKGGAGLRGVGIKNLRYIRFLTEFCILKFVSTSQSLEVGYFSNIKMYSY